MSRKQLGDFYAAFRSDQPTLERYREVRKDREILRALIDE